ncbi:protein FAM173A [Arapaima gigas]
MYIGYPHYRLIHCSVTEKVDSRFKNVCPPLSLNYSDDFSRVTHEHREGPQVTSLHSAVMDPDSPDYVLPRLSDKPLGGWGLLQVAAGSGLAVYAVWVGILMPGFRRVPLRLQVPYLPASRVQVGNVMALLKGRQGGITDLGSGDGRIVLEAYRQGFRPAVGYELNPWLVRLAHFHAWRAGHYGQVSYLREDLWKVNLSQCKNITVFLAPSVLPLLQKKLLSELPEDAVVVAGRYPFPNWTAYRVEGEGVDKAWAYFIQAQRQAPQAKVSTSNHSSE